MTKRRSAGFTILEVLIATMVFTLVLMICVQVITRIGQLYFKGVTSSQIQDLTRNLSEEFSTQIQFGSSIPYPDTITGGTAGTPLIFCVGDNRYKAVMNKKLGDVTSVLQRKAYSGACDTDDTLGSFDGATELAVKNMRILKLSIVRSASHPSVWKLDIRLALGDDDLFSYPVTGATDTPAYESATCKSGISGTQFCATSELSSTLLRRVKVE